MNMFKKAFTLAEVLVVLTVIGVIATISIPQLTSGIDSAQYKAGYKKAYMVISNVAGMEKARGKLPKTVSKDGMINFFKAIDKNIVVDGYAPRKGSGNANSAGEIWQGVTWQGTTYGDENRSLEDSSKNYDTKSPWIVAADGMAYAVGIAEASSCKKRSEIKQATTPTEAMNRSCLWVAVDVNGLIKGPNIVEPQTTSITSNVKLKKLTGDKYYIYIGSDGATGGSELYTVSGRILAGVK